MKSRFISKRWLGSLMLSMAGVFALSALPAQAQAATQEEAVVKQLQKVISKCPSSVEQYDVEQMLKQIGFRETFKASDQVEQILSLVMERETPISILGQPTQKFVLSYAVQGEGISQDTISAVFPKSAFNAVKKYQRGYKDYIDHEFGFFIIVRQADDGVYVSCLHHYI